MNTDIACLGDFVTKWLIPKHPKLPLHDPYIERAKGSVEITFLDANDNFDDVIDQFSEDIDGLLYIEHPIFNPSTDTLEIDTDSFGIDSSATFASGKNKKKVKKKLAKQDFDFLYDEKKGGLYFNENGSDKGFGDGGIIAILKGAPDLTSGNLEFI